MNFSIFLLLLVGLIQGEVYCPTQGDFSQGGGVSFDGNGWTIHGGGGVHGLTSFDLLSGFVQFDMDTSGAQGGVNNNFYTASPERSYFPQYCDIQPNSSPQCMEMDIVENNGNCLTQVTWHTWPNHNGDCDEGGCWGQAYSSGRRTYRADFSSDGFMTVSINGNRVSVTNPTPSNNAKNYVAKQTKALGLQFHSTQWVGWVPGGNCPGGNNLDGSSFSVKNLVVSGSIVQGKEPTKCNDLEPKFYEQTMAALNRTKSWFETQAMAEEAQKNYRFLNNKFNATTRILN